jgi:signal peptidase I
MNNISAFWHKFLYTRAGRVFLFILIGFFLIVSFSAWVKVSELNTFEGWLTLITGISGVGYCFYHLLSQKRLPKSDEEVEERNGFLQKISFWLSDFCASIFPILFVVLILRSFLFEPFRIPSGSMLPTLHLGDFIVVNKYVYGVKLPLSGRKIINNEKPKRGDIVVFRFPSDESLDYIKRVIGIPGDTIVIKGTQVFVNGKLLGGKQIGIYKGKQSEYVGGIATEFKEQYADKNYSIFWVKNRLSSNQQKYVVPAGHYFVMGDNRSNSNDSRYWGWVPEQNIKGKAVYIWLNWFDEIDWSRVGSSL